MIVPYEICQYELASQGRQNTLARPPGPDQDPSKSVPIFLRGTGANLKMVPIYRVPIPRNRTVPHDCCLTSALETQIYSLKPAALRQRDMDVVLHEPPVAMKGILV